MALICLVAGIVSCLIFKNKARVEVLSGEKSGEVVDGTASKDVSKWKLIKGMFDFSVVKEWRFLLWCASDIFMESAYNVPNYFLPCKQLLYQ